MEKYIKKYTAGFLSIAFIVGLLYSPVLAESQIYVAENSKSEAVAVIEGQYFDEKDPRGIGEFTEEEIQFGLAKSDLACQVIKIRDRSINQKDSSYNIASKGKKPINAEDVATVMEYIEKYAPEANLSDYIIAPDIAVIKEYIAKYASEASVDDLIAEKVGNVSPTAVGDYTSKDLNLPGQVQKYDNYCAPASIYAVLKGKGLNVNQDTLASYCGIVPNGVVLI